MTSTAVPIHDLAAAPTSQMPEISAFGLYRLEPFQRFWQNLKLNFGTSREAELNELQRRLHQLTRAQAAFVVRRLLAASELGITKADPPSLVSMEATIKAKARAVDRLHLFATYESDWDDCGTAQPNRLSIASAIAFLGRIKPWHPKPIATLDRDGSPVIEFEDSESGFFGSITFTSPRFVRLYARKKGAGSKYSEGEITADETRIFLRDEMQLPAS